MWSLSPCLLADPCTRWHNWYGPTYGRRAAKSRACSVRPAAPASSVMRRMATAATVRELRRARRTRRLGQLEWFEIAYRVYLTALAGGLAIAWLSGLVSDEPVTRGAAGRRPRPRPRRDRAVRRGGVRPRPAQRQRRRTDLARGRRRAPSDAGSGATPCRAADARSVQRCRALAFAGLIVGGIAGELASRRLPGSAPAWAASGAATGALIGLLFVVTAVVTHALRVPRWAATTLGTIVAVACRSWRRPEAGYGPGNGLGSLALWGMRTNAVDLVSVAVVLAMGAAALVLADRLRLEPLDAARQPRVAAALRRHDAGPAHRGPAAPAVARRAAPHPAVVADEVVVVGQRRPRRVAARPARAARYPASRLVRMATLAAAGGVCAVVVDRGTTPLVLGVGGRGLPPRPRRHRADVAGDRPARPRRRRAHRSGLAAACGTSPRRRPPWCRSP